MSESVANIRTQILSQGVAGEVIKMYGRFMHALEALCQPMENNVVARPAKAKEMNKRWCDFLIRILLPKQRRI